jgi:hypothetical protein
METGSGPSSRGNGNPRREFRPGAGAGQRFGPEERRAPGTGFRPGPSRRSPGVGAREGRRPVRREAGRRRAA